MSHPLRIQRKRRPKGFRLPPDAVVVTRPTKWGNPFSVGIWGRELALRLFRNAVMGTWGDSAVKHLPKELRDTAFNLHLEFRNLFENDPIGAARRELRGKELACYCSDADTCHADVWAEVANP